MATVDHAREQSLFLELADHPRGEAERLLRKREDIDSELRVRLRRLLDAHEEAR